MREVAFKDIADLYNGLSCMIGKRPTELVLKTEDVSDKVMDVLDGAGNHLLYVQKDFVWKGYNMSGLRCAYLIDEFNEDKVSIIYEDFGVLRMVRK